MLRAWDKMMAWEIENRPLKMSEKAELAKLPFEELEKTLADMAKEHKESRYKT